MQDKLPESLLIARATEAFNLSNYVLAEKILKKVLINASGNAIANHLMGSIYAKKGDFNNALPYFENALDANLGKCSYWLGYANALFQLQRFNQASEILKIARSRGCVGATFDQLEKTLGLPIYQKEILYERLMKFIEQGEIARVLTICKNFIKDEKAPLGLLNVMIAAYEKSEDYEQAVEHYLQILDIRPNYSIVYNNMGTALRHLGKFDEAIQAFKKAISLKPDLVEAYSNMGEVLRIQGKLKPAYKVLKKAIDLAPSVAELHFSLGNVMNDECKFDEALAAYGKATTLDPNHAKAYSSISYILLARQDFKLGFELREWRWKTVERKGTVLQSPKSMWKGEINKRVLVWGEQGIGDEIMFSSTVPELCKIASTVMLHCDERLIPLFKRSFPANVEYSIRSEGVLSLNYDFHIPIGSLAKTFRTSRDSFRATSTGFLNYDKSRADQLRETILSRGATKIIGVGWNTSSALRDASKRNIKLSDLAQSLASTNTQLVSLQYGDVDEEVTRLKNDHGIEVMQMTEVDNKNDMDGLAALIMACDEVVSTTNAMVHLAGALGASTKVLLPFAPRWIWGNGSESFWYDSVIPYKQIKSGDWSNVLEDVTK